MVPGHGRSNGKMGQILGGAVEVGLSDGVKRGKDGYSPVEERRRRAAAWSRVWSVPSVGAAGSRMGTPVGSKWRVLRV